ncbi:MAG: peptidoglycan bridge formation glycyltransferase FemA/FemB family protein [Candidatus Paceibacterota bacterium]
MSKENEQIARFTQSAIYGKWQTAVGHEVRTFILTDNGNQLAWQGIRYPLTLGKCYWYIPHGPIVVGQLTEKLLDQFQSEGEKLLKETNGVFLRFDPWPKQENSTKLWKKYFRLAPKTSYKSSFVQSPNDWRLNLEKTESDLLKAMHEKTRYGINLAKRKEVIVEKVPGPEMEKYFKEFYQLMCETANRNNFRLHPEAYYKAIWETAEASDNIALFIAKYNNLTLAMHLIFFFGDTAYYPFGASSTLGREKMPTQLLHWEAIREAKKLGYSWYNFGAVEDPNGRGSHNWGGLSIFKRRFGGEMLSYSPLFDLVGQPFWYLLYNLRRKLKK